MKNRDEIKRLKKENHELKKKLYKLETKVHADEEKNHENADCLTSNNYFSFLLSKVKKKNFYSSFEKATKYFRNSLWITTVLRVGLYSINICRQARSLFFTPQCLSCSSR